MIDATKFTIPVMTEADRWTASFFDHAFVAASLSRDPKAKVGAVIVDERNRIVSSGFNGLPSGIGYSVQITQNREDRLACTLHAEENALAFAWRDVKGMTLLCTRHPCARCAAMIVQRGITCVAYIVGNDTINPDWQHSFILAQDMFKQAGIEVVEWVMMLVDGKATYHERMPDIDPDDEIPF